MLPVGLCSALDKADGGSLRGDAMYRGLRLKRPKEKFPLSKWEWAFLSGMGLFFAVAIAGTAFPASFGWLANLLAGTIGVAAAGAALTYWVLVPLGALLVVALGLCIVVLIVAVWVFVAVLNFMGAAWRGELRP